MMMVDELKGAKEGNPPRKGRKEKHYLPSYLPLTQPRYPRI
jgi:hypothetical protein